MVICFSDNQKQSCVGASGHSDREFFRSPLLFPDSCIPGFSLDIRGRLSSEAAFYDSVFHDGLASRPSDGGNQFVLHGFFGRGAAAFRQAGKPSFRAHGLFYPFGGSDCGL